MKPRLTTAALLVATAAAALLYWLVQPLVGRLIIPRFGGGAASWIVCLLYFQTALLAGYLYAFFLLAKLPQRLQPWAHLLTLVLAALQLPLESAAAFWTPTNWERPIAEMFRLLGSNSALLLIAIAATPSLATRWAAQSRMERPLRVYAVSNLFSFVALVAYPTLLEPSLGLSAQAQSWSWLYGALVAATLVAALAYAPGGENRESPGMGPYGAWMLLAAAGSALLAVVSDQITKELPVIPFLWLVPLGVYLASYVIAFARPSLGASSGVARMIRLMIPLAVGALAAAAWIPWPVQVGVLCLALFAICLACHSEIVISAGGAEDSAALYLCLAIGGAAGTAVVSLISPALFDFQWEAYAAVVAGPTILAYRKYQAGEWKVDFSPETWVRKPPPLLFAVAVVLAVMVAVANRRATIEVERNLYGTARVIEGEDDLGRYRILRHGSIMHGLQYVDSELSSVPTSYFGQSTPIAWAIDIVRGRAQGRVRVGVIGLGVGTIAAYGDPGDHFKFYELNPAVARIAREHFSYLSGARASVEVAVGDGRVLLEREAPQLFDVFIIDAFTSEAVPTHLLTREAGELYRKHLSAGGVMALHISNRFIDLEPAVAALGRGLGFEARYFHTERNPTTAEEPSTWIVMGPTELVGARGDDVTEVTIGWSDDFSSVWPLVRR